MKRTTVSERALVLAPRGRDASIAVAILRETGLTAETCPSLPDLIVQLNAGAAFVVVAEEALATADLAPLASWLADQEEWSDLPFVLLTTGRGGLERNPAARRYLDVLGNVTFLERPFHPTTLVSLARSALRGRHRQYEARARLEALRTGEARYRTLFEAIDAGFCIIGLSLDETTGAARDYRFLEVNPAFAKQTGLADAEGRWMHDLAPGHEQHWFNVYGRVALTGEAVRFEHEANALGRYYDVHAFRVGPPQARRVAVLFNDITARRNVEERLRQSEARFQAIANSIDQMIWSTRPDGYHDYYNQRWYDYTGVPQGSTDGEAWNGLFHHDDQERAWAVWRHSLETGEPYHIEYRLRHRSGHYRWVLGRAQCVRDEDGRITRWFGTCTDIQDIIEAREVLARSHEELERLVTERTSERNRIWEMSRDLFAIMSFDGYLKAINPAWETTLGFDKATLLARPFPDRFTRTTTRRCARSLSGCAAARRSLGSRIGFAMQMGPGAGSPGVWSQRATSSTQSAGTSRPTRRMPKPSPGPRSSYARRRRWRR